MTAGPHSKRVAIAAVAALALAPTSACSAATKPVRGANHSHTLVAYEMNGLASTSLTVSTDAQAKLTTSGGRHAARFHLDNALWKRLKATLKRTSLHALAGGGCPPRPYPDALMYVITVAHDTVCTTEGKVPHELEPLMKVLGEVISAGERRISNSA